MMNAKMSARGASSLKKKARIQPKKCEDNWIHILHVKGNECEDDGTEPQEGVIFKMDGCEALRPSIRQLCHIWLSVS